ASSGSCAVEWAPTVTGTWSRSWVPLAFIAASGATHTVEVPLFYRVIHQDFHLSDFVATNVVLAIGNGTNTVYTGFIPDVPLIANTVAIVAGGVAFIDNGAGTLMALNAAASGLLNYGTGAWTIDLFGLPLPGGVPIQATYVFGPGIPTIPISTQAVVAEVLGVGDGLATSQHGLFGSIPVAKNSVVMHAGPLTLTDDGNGNLSGGGATGRILYTTGFWFISTPGALGDGVAITADYSYHL
ncbi:MAG: hypothetical protein O3A51_12650, partial [Verrucomicrobia bacterium]|nr:hypothetical protein [Verrucomicrobiota bacterium]